MQYNGTFALVTPDGSATSLSDLGVALESAPGSGVAGVEPEVWTGLVPYGYGSNGVGTSAAVTTSVLARSLWLGTMVAPRRLRLRLWPRMRSAGWSLLRSALLALLNPEMVTPARPAYLRYTLGERVRELAVVYAGGLSIDENEGQLTLELLALEPFWVDPAEESLTLAVQQPVSGERVWQRNGGGWAGLGTLGGEVETLLLGADGTLYAGGSFINDTGAYLARYDAGSGLWQGVGEIGAPVQALALGADGRLYASALTSGFVRVWDGISWNGLADGPEFWPEVLTVGPDGALYAGGENAVAMWDGSAWQGLGSVGGRVHALLVQSDGTVLAGGDMSGGVLEWDGISWSTLGAGLSLSSGDGVVRALLAGPLGEVSAGGRFDRSGERVLSHVAVWNGVHWRAAGAGVGDEVWVLANDGAGGLLAAGLLTSADGVSLPGPVARWNGSVWLPLDLTLTPAAPVVALVGTGDQMVLGRGSGVSGATAAALTTVTYTGSAAAWPVFELVGPGAVWQLLHASLGVGIWLDVTLLAGETLTIDLRPPMRRVESSFRGNLLSAVRAGSRLGDWRLRPGSNRIAVFAQSGVTVQMRWQRSFWGVDDV
ncbi:MAG: hypothetical protein HC837_20485 [Chloroflexaceae bacterium]|nr:hypothetical protein [Chloroflexaceae bacterium]